MKAPTGRFAPAVLLMLLVGGVTPAWVSAQFLPPPPPLAPHPDSSGTVVMTQAASLLAASMLLERPMRAWVAADGPGEHHRLSGVGNLLGRGPTVAMVVAGVYGGARIVGIEEISTPAGRTFAALLVAGAANGALKFGVGRGRPKVSGDRAAFRPFTMDDDWQSFPSGHAVTAFAVAAAIAEQADRRWVTYSTYGAATLVGWSRMHEDRHWASDVVAGALVGSLAARLTVRRLEARAARAGETSGGGREGDSFLRFALHPLPGGVAISIHPR